MRGVDFVGSFRGGHFLVCKIHTTCDTWHNMVRVRVMLAAILSPYYTNAEAEEAKSHGCKCTPY